ncbi:glyoxylate/hydroxypyruvate reductase HPR3 [Amaranthus tricolor]|uniref:glyoxylate/hydroxypyruvate reductase HPR3 n=1 Tax=Amaranthus tricolor TaxID=29722 RepID=UPI00258995CD|nr:glyoxylate/hydroxypyruvate reductase HPR3 [Amaranthus tricolor]
MANTDKSSSHQPNKEPKPLLVIHRIPDYNFFFHNRIAPFFSLLDPLATSIDTLSFLRSHGAAARALVCVGPSPLRKDILDCLPSLECVITSCIGVDHIDLSECRRRGISVANVGEAFSDDTADCAVGLLLDVLRKVSSGNRFARAGSWVQIPVFPLGSRLKGKRVGIVGLGSIGSRIARRLLSFGCDIAYIATKKKPSISFPYYANIHDLAVDSDILIVCCSLTKKTHHMINKDVLSALGNEGVIINVGRGALIDEEELVRFLVEGKIKGAGLDVFKNEPNVPKELFGLECVVLSPHHSVWTNESFKAAEDTVVANLEAFFLNKPLITPIKWE